MSLMWKWNEVELPINMGDAGFQEKYEQAFKNMEKTELELEKVGMLSNITKQYCQMFYKFFDDVYGNGTGEKLFEGRMDMLEIDMAYDSWIKLCAKDVDMINKKRAALYGKYNVGKKR